MNVRKKSSGDALRLIVALSGIIFGLGFTPAAAATPTNADELSTQTQDSYRTAKTQRDLDSIEEWCTDIISSFSNGERNRLMVYALERIRANDLESANKSLKKVEQQIELDSNMAAITCRPDGNYAAIRRARRKR